jgi:hypothetical protein
MPEQVNYHHAQEERPRRAGSAKPSPIQQGKSRWHFVLLSSSPGDGNAWAKISGRVHNLMHDDYDEDAAWTLTCRISKIVPGTVGFICFADGCYGKISALFIFDGRTWEEQEVNGPVTYGSGVLWRLPSNYEVDGARLRLDPDWSGRAPFTKLPNRKVLPFRNGEALKGSDVAVIWSHLHPFVRNWIVMKSNDVCHEVGWNQEDA